MIYVIENKKYLVVSQNKGTPILTPKYYSPYYGYPLKGAPNFGKPPFQKHRASPSKICGKRKQAQPQTANMEDQHASVLLPTARARFVCKGNYSC